MAAIKLSCLIDSVALPACSTAVASRAARMVLARAISESLMRAPSSWASSMLERRLINSGM